MSDELRSQFKWEREKRERARLRATQRKLRKRFLQTASALMPGDWKAFSKEFLVTLDEDKRLEYYSLDTDRYLLAIFNLMSALGFRIHTGEIPRVSGVQREYGFSMLAFDDRRLVIIDDSPETLYTTLADVQPVSPLPVLGLLYNRSIALEKPKYEWSYTEESIMRSRRLAGALALGYFTISMQDLKEALSTNPFTNPEALQRLAAKLGLDRFLRPPVDALPVYGEFISRSNDLRYDIDQFLKDAGRTEKAGAPLENGDVTQATPSEALSDPGSFFKELHKAKLLNTQAGSPMNPTRQGYSYLRSAVLPFPLGQLLHFTCFAARDEIRKTLQSGFMESLAGRAGTVKASTLPVFIPVEDFDSFAKVNIVAPHSVEGQVPVSTPENDIKKLIHAILGDPFERRDWGGEQNDIFTSRVMYQGRRLLAPSFSKGRLSQAD